MGFPIAHGLKLAANAYIENMVVERLASDPSVVEAGRVWFNTTSKSWKASFLSELGAVIVRTFSTKEELDAFIADLSSTEKGKGLAKVGFSGHTGSNGQFAVSAGSAETAVKSIVQEIDQLEADFVNLVADAVTPLQNELDKIETATGLNADGTLPAFSGNYTTGKTTIIAAVNALDTQAKTNAEAIEAEETARINADALKVNKAGDTMTGDLSFGGTGKVTGLAEPVNDSDAATKYYVDSVAQGLDWKESVRVVATSNVDLTTGGLLTIDDVKLVEGDRVLVKAQTNAAENGIYIVVDGGAWTRSVDADNNPEGEITSGAAVYVEEGKLKASQGYRLITPNPIILGTTPLEFTQVSGAGQIIAGAGISKDGNEIFLNFGAGITELPNDEIGVEVYSAGGLFTTTDGENASTEAGATLSIKLAADSKLTLSPNGLKVDSTWASSLTEAATLVQNELDVTQIATGLNTDGTLPSLATSNYIASQTSILGAVTTLDSNLKTTETALTQEVTDRENAVQAVQNELDATQLATGLNADGTYAAVSTANYISTATSVKVATELLDTAVHLNATTIANFKTNYNATLFRYEATSAQSSYTLKHNLGTQNVDVAVWVKDDVTGKFHNDLTAITVEDANNVTVDLTEAKIIRVVIKSFEDIA